MKKLQEKTQQADELYQILDDFTVKLDDMQFEQRMVLIGKPTEVENTKNEKVIQLEKKKEQLAEDQKEQVTELQDNIEGLDKNIKQLAEYNNISDAENARSMAEYIKTSLDKYRIESDELREREKLFGQPLTNWSKIDEFDNRLKPFHN